MSQKETNVLRCFNEVMAFHFSSFVSFGFRERTYLWYARKASIHLSYTCSVMQLMFVGGCRK